MVADALPKHLSKVKFVKLETSIPVQDTPLKSRKLLNINPVLLHSCSSKRMQAGSNQRLWINPRKQELIKKVRNNTANHSLKSHVNHKRMETKYGYGFQPRILPRSLSFIILSAENHSEQGFQKTCGLKRDQKITAEEIMLLEHVKYKNGMELFHMKSLFKNL
jgi:hypothetical protein